MAVIVKDHDSKTVATFDSNGSGEVKSLRRPTIMYVRYNKGSEDGFTFSFDFYEEKLDSWFPLQFDDGSTIVDYVRTISDSKNYRIVVPVSENEEKIRVNITMSGDTSAPGTLLIDFIPMHFSF